MVARLVRGWCEVNMHIGTVAVDRNFRKRRCRQIGRLIYYYCCVKYMVKEHGKWVEDTVLCPACDGDGEFILYDGEDVLTCGECGGKGSITMKRYKKWCKEIE